MSQQDINTELCYIGAAMVSLTQEVAQHIADPEWFDGVLASVPLSRVALLVRQCVLDGMQPSLIHLRQRASQGDEISRRISTDLLMAASRAYSESGGYIKDFSDQLAAKYTSRRVVSLFEQGARSATLGDDWHDVILQLQQLATNGPGSGGFQAAVAFERLLEQIKERRANPKSNIKIFTGLVSLDRKLDIRPGDVTIIGARPSVGKTSFMVQMACHNAKKGIPTVFYTGEMTEPEIVGRMVAQEFGYPARTFRNGEIDFEDIANMQVAAKLKTLPLWIVRDRNANRILQDIQRRSLRDGVQMVVVDYLQLLSFSSLGLSDDSTRLRMSAFTKTAKEMALRQQLAVVIASQLNRDYAKGADWAAIDWENPKSRRKYRPKPHHLKESGSSEEDADNVVLLWRFPSDDESVGPDGEAVIGKQRNGPTGVVDISFRGDIVRFEETRRVL